MDELRVMADPFNLEVRPASVSTSPSPGHLDVAPATAGACCNLCDRTFYRFAKAVNWALRLIGKRNLGC